MLPVQIAEPLVGGPGHAVGKAAGKKKNGKLIVRGFRPTAMLPTLYRLYSEVLQQLAGQAIHTRYTAHSMVMSLADKPMRWSSSYAAWLSKRTNGGYQSS